MPFDTLWGFNPVAPLKSLADKIDVVHFGVPSYKQVIDVDKRTRNDCFVLLEDEGGNVKTKGHEAETVESLDNLLCPYPWNICPPVGVVYDLVHFAFPGSVCGSQDRTWWTPHVRRMRIWSCAR